MPGFLTSHLPCQIYLSAFPVLPLTQSFFCCCSLLHWHFWRNQNSYAVLKCRANSLTVLLSQKLLTTGHWILLRNHCILKQKLPTASREITYNSEDTETTGEEEEVFPVSRYFFVITLCKNGELTWIYSVPPPLTYPQVFFCCLGNGLSWWKPRAVFSVGHLRLKPLPVIS